MVKEFFYKSYKAKATISQQDAIKLCDSFFNNQLKTLQTFNDNSHTLVKHIEYEGKEYILKIPRGRNEGFLERFRSIFRRSYIERTFNSHINFLKLGYSCPMPILMLEKRAFRVCTFSIFIYEFIKGREGNYDDGNLITPIMTRLYKDRIVRGDPKPQNFIIKNNNQVYLIDFKFKTSLIFKKQGVTQEYLKHIEYIPEAINALPAKETSSFYFKINKHYKDLKENLKRIKQKLKTKA